MLKPDLLLVAGDRAEILAATVTAAYMNIPSRIFSPGICRATSTGLHVMRLRSSRTFICRPARIRPNASEDG